MTNNFFERLLSVLVFICERVGLTCTLTKPDEIIGVLSFRFGGFQITTGDNFMSELREGQKVDATASFRTRSGNEAQIQEGSVKWKSSDESIATVTQDERDEKKAVVRGINGADNGSATIECRADGDPDSDSEREIILTGTVTVTRGEAFVGELSFGKASDDDGSSETGGGGTDSGAGSESGEPSKISNENVS